MKFTYRVSIALAAFLLGVIAFLLYQPLSERLTDQLPSISVEGEISFRYQGCAGRLSVFALENQTGEPIYVPVQIAAFWNWREYYDAGLHSGMVFIEYQAPGSQNFKDVTLPVLKQPSAFLVVLPRSGIRYGVELQRTEGKYQIRAPYLEIADGVSSLSRSESGALVARDDERLNGLWKEAMSEPMENVCK